VTSSSSTNASSETELTVDPAASVERRQDRRGRARRSRLGSALTRSGIALCLASIAAAPLAAGGVHRPTLAVLFGTVASGLVLLWLGSEVRGRPLRVGLTVVLPVVFLAVPVLQSIPLPMRARGVVDAKGSALLTDDAFAPPTVWPLSLDPVSTRAHIGKAAAALVVFLVAYHLASGQRHRRLVVRTIAIAGIAAVVVGITHKIIGMPKIYGVFVSTQQALLTGPFVNPNHTAEFLELAAFACLACSLQRATALNRVGWMVGALFCAGGAAATLSRGSVLGLGMGILMFAWLRYLARDGGSVNRRRRTSLEWAIFLILFVAIAAGALGASQLVDKFRSGGVHDVRFQLWRESLRVLVAHPFGIGRGAFERVFPVYRSFTTPLSIRFAFTENQPLQLLIDGGWVFFAAMAGGVVLTAAQLIRHGRRDGVEAALIGGVFAIVVHSFVDFGLETLGVLLPFMALLGTIFGRTRTEGQAIVRFRRPLFAGAIGALLVGLASVSASSSDDFDALLKKTSREQGRLQLLQRAQRVHPLDYFYALNYARLEPVGSPEGGPSPRFHALNRALALCPACEVVHADVARNLWSIGRRRQALLEWRTTVDLQPKLLRPVIGELFAAGARPEELAAAASSRPDQMIEVASFLSSVSHPEEAMVVLEEAEAAGASRGEVLITRAGLQLKLGLTVAVTDSLARAHAAGIRDPRLALDEAELRLATQGDRGPDDALAILDAAAIQYPANLDVQRRRLDLVTRFGKWQAVDRALAGFTEALYQNQRSVGEAHTAAARIHARFSRWTSALAEYRISLASDPWNVALWVEFGHAAESAGRDTTAREAYLEAARLSPQNPAVTAALSSLDARMARLRRSGAAGLP
jgi:tetratricopeptide (TPR) repeat protein